MSSIGTLLAKTSRFKLGWGILLVCAALMTLMHFVLMLTLDQPILFFGYTLFNLYALLVIYFPLRRGERWAWWSTWLLPIGLALPALLDTGLGFYYGLAAACVLGLWLTFRA